MHTRTFPCPLVAVLCFVAAGLRAQAPQTPASSLTGRTITAIGYQVNSSSTIDFKNTGVLAGAGGEAKVSAKPSVTTVEAQVVGLTPPTRLGAEFLTYVLWAVSRPRQIESHNPVAEFFAVCHRRALFERAPAQ